MNEYELKIKALLEGLEIQNIEKFMREAEVVDYRNLGKAYVSAVKGKIKEKAESSSKCEAEKIDGRCPKCGGKLEYSHFDRVLLSNPHKRQINCTECAHVGYLIERSEE